MKDAVVGPLDEGTEVVGELAAGKEADLLHRKVVVGAEAGRQAAWLRRLEMRKPRLQRDGKGRTLPIAPALRVAAELESAAERRQFKKRGMARRTGFAGLPRIERQCFRKPRR